MLESIVSALLVAAIGAVVLVAYRHPDAFAALHGAVKRPLGLLAIGVFAYMLGDNGVRGEVQALLGKAQEGDESLKTAIRAALQDEPPLGWMLLGVGAVWVFLEALSALPRLGITGAAPAKSEKKISKSPPPPSPS